MKKTFSGDHAFKFLFNSSSVPQDVVIKKDLNSVKNQLIIEFKYFEKIKNGRGVMNYLF